MKMAVANMAARVSFLLNRIQEKLWVKPLLFSVLSIAAVFGARLADHTGLDRIARLGRLGNTIDKVEKATADSIY